MRESRLRSAAQQFSTSVIAREVLSDAASILNRDRIDVMPLKGVLLQALVYADAMDRPLKDVDIAVRSADFEGARAALSRAGYGLVREEGGMYEVVLRAERFPLCVDLHRAFAAARRFRLTPDAMFGRGRRDSGVFGFPVVLPDDYDLYAHLLAHTVLDYVAGVGWHRPEDLGAVARVRGLSAEECAQRLCEHGLARFSRLALSPRTPLGADRFGAEVLRHLPRDPAGSLLANAADRLIRGAPAASLARRGVGLLLNPTLSEAGLALIEALAERGRRAIPAVRHWTKP